MDAAERYGAEMKITAFDVLDSDMLNALYEFQRKNNPRLAGKSMADIAMACEASISTLKALLNGTNKNPRIGTIKRFLTCIGGGSIDRLTGLAPPRDFALEEAQYDKTLVEAMQARLDAKRERIEEYEKTVKAQEEELLRLRKLVLEKGEACSHAEARAAAAEKMVAVRDASIIKHDDVRKSHIETIGRLERQNDIFRRVLIITSAISVAAIIGLAFYFGWDISHPAQGPIQY